MGNTLCKTCIDPAEVDQTLPVFKDVLRAANVLKGKAHRTQVMTCTTLNEYLG